MELEYVIQYSLETGSSHGAINSILIHLITVKEPLKTELLI